MAHDEPHAPATVPIETERLTLRTYRPGDLEALLDLYRRPDVVRYLYSEPWTLEDARVQLDRRLERTRLETPGDALQLAVVRREDEAYLGEVTLRWQASEHREAEIGFVLHPDRHGRGYATEAAGELLRLAFDGLRLHRVFGRCDGRNERSARLMERLGMRREAHFLRNEFVKGEWTDELVYAMLEDEWAAGRR